MAERLNGDELNRRWSIGAKHALYHHDGTWFHQLTAFPGALCDRDGYVLFSTEEQFRACPGVTCNQDVNVPGGISALPNYRRVLAFAEVSRVSQQREAPEVPPGLSVAALRELLVETLGEYDSSIGLQITLLDRLIGSVRQETARQVRTQCAAVASDIGDRQVSEDAMEAADAIARAIRWGRSGI